MNLNFNDLGSFLLLSSWVLALFGLLVGIYSGITKNSRWLESGRRATLAAGACCLASLLCLGYLFLNSDFSNQYVWQFSNKEMPSIYKFTAIWGGMDGSMLLWCSFLALCSATVAYRLARYPQQLKAWLVAVINSSSLFFITVVTYLTNPFRYIDAPFIPPDGNGLNPLLQNPYMAIHPPLLYMGFTALSIPFAFCMAALLSGQTTNDWIRLTRRWTVIAWGFLTLGVSFGGYWAYIELGWGGFWAWDPVENASFMPWLTATAFLHSVMVQERKNMLKFWNIWLIVLSYSLTVFGTFLTRSGVVQSVHAFASTDVGWVFLLYLGIIFTVTATLTILRRKTLAPEREIESFFSRESVFLLNNLILLSIFFATLWGVMFPIISEAVTGVKQTVSVPFFNAVNVPLFLAMIFFMGVGPLIAWQKASFVQLRKAFLLPFLLALFVAILLVWAGVEGFYPILSYSLCFFVLLTILGEFHRGMKAQRTNRDDDSMPKRFSELMRKHRRRYAGHLIHLGVLVATIGITASMAHKVEREFTLSFGESYSIGRFTLELQDLREKNLRNFQSLYAEVRVLDRASKAQLGLLTPELRYYHRNRETTSEVSIRKSLREDLYIVLAGLDEESQSKAAFKVYLNPLQVWLWIGVIIMAFGTVLIIFDPRALREKKYRAPKEKTNL